MTEWMVAPCLDVLLGQVNRAAPRRSKRSDGSIGDAAHAARTSQHNPLKLPFCGTPLVRARDFTHDPANGFDAGAFANKLTRSGDPRIKYVIWNWQIWYPNGGWKKYTGTNGHETHCHLSVTDAPNIMDLNAWRVEGYWTSVVDLPPATPPPGRRNLREGDVGADVWGLAVGLNRVFPGYKATPIDLDAVPKNQRFGPKTKSAVLEFQENSNLARDGIVGPQTWRALARYSI
jgi:peptidoglycan hydrolase-like protein with peptidoglycan-binding domain